MVLMGALRVVDRNRIRDTREGVKITLIPHIFPRERQQLARLEDPWFPRRTDKIRWAAASKKSDRKKSCGSRVWHVREPINEASRAWPGLTQNGIVTN